VIQAKITARREFTPKTIFIGYFNANFLANFQKSRPLAPMTLLKLSRTRPAPSTQGLLRVIPSELAKSGDRARFSVQKQGNIDVERSKSRRQGLVEGVSVDYSTAA
jgi:hypothetical protein